MVKNVNKVKNETLKSATGQNEDDDLKRALAESLKDLPGPSSAVNPWEVPTEPEVRQPESIQEPEVKPEVKPEIIEIKDEGPKCYAIFGRRKPNETKLGKSIRGSKTPLKSRGRGRGRGRGSGRGKVTGTSRGSLRGRTTLKRSRFDDAESERKAKLKVISGLKNKTVCLLRRFYK